MSVNPAEKASRNDKIIAEVKELQAQDIKNAPEKVGSRYGISKRRVYAIMNMRSKRTHV